MEECCQLSGYVSIELRYTQQIATYECSKIGTAYRNAIVLQFGKGFCMFINQLMRQKEKTRKRKQELQKEKKSKDEINNIVYSEITQPYAQLKLSLASDDIHNAPTGLLSKDRIPFIQESFRTYGSQYQFKKESIYYDCKENFLKYLKAYYKLSELRERSGFKSFTCFPFRWTLIHCYMTIDTMILNSHTLQNSQRSKLDKNLI